MNAFVNGISKSVVTLIVGNLCDGIDDMITEAKSTIDSDISAFDYAITRLTTNLNSYRTTIENGLSRYFSRSVSIGVKALTFAVHGYNTTVCRFLF